MGQKVIIHTSKDDMTREFDLQSIYDSQLLELAEVRNPSVDKHSLTSIASQLKSGVKPVYVEYPWRNITIEMLPENEFMELKTNRNRQLITTEEQLSLYGTSISMAGMSVGSSLLYGLIGTGIGNRLIILIA